MKEQKGFSNGNAMNLAVVSTINKCPFTKCLSAAQVMPPSIPAREFTIKI